MMSSPIAAAIRRPTLRQAISRGFRRRCPQCGEGPLFERWVKTYERCSECGLRFQRDGGNTLMFIIITDRIPILIGIALLYFGIRPSNWLTAALFALALAIPIIGTLTHRQGIALALDYLAGLYLDDPAQHVTR